MTFPQDPLVVLTEIQVGSTDWANVSDYVRDDPGHTITRGRADESGQAAPSTCAFTLDDPTGLFSTSNPTSELYRKVGRNTPVRVSLGRGAYGMVVSDGDGRAAAADSVPLSITGDLDVRVDMELLDGGVAANSWTAGGFDLASKWNYFVGQISWCFITIAGKLRVSWSNDGSAALSATSSVALAGPAGGRRAVRFTLDVNNGAAGNTVTFYTAPTMAGPWTQLGTPVVQAGVTTIFDSPTSVRIGAAPQTNSFTHGHTAPATVYSAQIQAGINGTVVASPDFTTQPLDPVPFGPSNFLDAQGNNWLFAGSSDAARIWYGDVDVRFWGEISSLTPKWDLSGKNRWTEIDAAGVLRRLGQGTDPAETGLKAFTLANPDALVTYFPLGGAAGTTYSLNLGPTYNLETRFYGFPTAANGGPGNGGPSWKYGEDMGAFLGTGMALFTTVGTASDSYMRGDVAAAYPNAAFDFVWQSLQLGELQVILTDYTGVVWQLAMHITGSPGVAQVSVIDPNTGPVGFSATGILPELLDDQIHHGRLQLTKNGTATDWVLYIDGVAVDSGSQPSYELVGISMFRLRYLRTGTESWVNLAHLTVWSHPTAATIPTAAEVSLAAHGYVGETAGERIERIAEVSGIALTGIGLPAETEVMGPQYSEATMSQLRDAENTDMGILAEPRSSFGLLYRTHRSLYNQVPALTLLYDERHLAPPLEPVDDDQLTRNDVTAVRRDGDSYRVRLETGPLSVQEPPAGVGRYKDEKTVNVEGDGQLPAIAGWLLHLGTRDETRFSSVAVDLAAAEIVAAGLGDDVRNLELGDLILIGNASAVDIYDDLQLIMLGYTETVAPRRHFFKFNCAPGAAYEVIELDDPDTRISSGDTSLTNATMTTTATSMKVLSADAVTLWTTDGAQMPISLMVAGEEMTVTAISGTTPGTEQTFTVVRSVNGVVKTHAVGEIVRQKREAVLAL